jgi:hypothetical protein
MSTPAALIATAKALVSDFLPDLCTVKQITAGAADGFGGEADTLTTVASSIKCLYEPIRDIPLMTQGGAVTGVSRFKVFLELTDVDLQNIAPGWQIVVAARGDKPQLTFEDPRRMDESNEVLLTVSAKLRQ